MRRVMVAVSAVLVCLALTGTPAAARIASSDFAIKFVSSRVSLGVFDNGQESGIGMVQITVASRNYGPSNSEPDELYDDITAPGGTVFTHRAEIRLANICTWIAPHTHVRCRAQGTTDAGGPWISWTLEFVLKKKCTTPGRYRFSYAGDPDTSNNTAILTVKVPGVTVADCAAKPASSRKPAASPKPVAIASPSLIAVSTSASPPAVSQTPTTAVLDSPTTDTADLVETASHNDFINSGTILGILGAIAGIALLAGLWLYHRRRQA